MVLPQEILGEEAISEADYIAALKESSKQKAHTIEMGLWPEQWSFMHAPNHKWRCCLYSGGKGAGKSTVLLLQLLRYADIPNSKIILTRLHFSSLKKSTLSDLLEGHNLLNRFTGEMIYQPPMLPAYRIAKYNSVEGKLVLTNGTTITCIGCSDTERLKSIPANAAFIDEATDLGLKNWIAVETRCRLPHKYPNFVGACTNPGFKNHFLYDYFVEQRNPTRKMICSPSYRNKFLGQDYLDYLNSLPEDVKRSEANGEWLDVGSMVFFALKPESTFQDISSLYKSEEINDWFIGADWGGGGRSGYAGMVLVGVHKDGRIMCFKEFCKAKQSEEDLLAWMDQYRELTQARVIYDSANATLANGFSQRGWNVIKCRPKNIESNVKTMNNLFSQDQLVIDNSCFVLRQQLEKSYRDNTGQIYKAKEFDVIDSWMYACTAIRNDELVETQTKLNNFWVYNPDK